MHGMALSGLQIDQGRCHHRFLLRSGPEHQLAVGDEYGRVFVNLVLLEVLARIQGEQDRAIRALVRAQNPQTARPGRLAPQVPNLHAGQRSNADTASSVPLHRYAC